jgi:flagellar basal-body rod modification protein FlgD
MSGTVQSASRSSNTSAYNSAFKSSAASQKTDFLKLLTQQLKSQNPLKPYDNQEFASQLAQFSQLDQLTSIKEAIEEQTTAYQSLNQTMTSSALPGMLGKTAKTKWNKAQYDGENSLTFGYNFSGSCKSAEVLVKNSSGSVIRKVTLGGADLTSGEHKFVWDGKDNGGSEVATGQYSIEVKTTNSSGSVSSPDVYVYGKIQAVRFNSDGTKLVVNGVETPLQNMVDISNS